MAKNRGMAKWILGLTFLLTLVVSAEPTTRVVLQTEMGDILLQLEPTQAPITTRNFLRYVDAGLYTNARFHRTVTLDPDNQPGKRIKIEVIQAGLGRGVKELLPIKLERTHRTGLRHRNGTVSMARLEPDTASSELFICVGDQPELDYGGRRNPDGQGFAAFGRVVQGMDVVRKIHRSRAEGQSLKPEVLIQSARRAK